MRRADSLRLLSGGKHALSRKRVNSVQLLRANLTAWQWGLLGAYWSCRSRSHACNQSMMGRERARRMAVRSRAAQHPRPGVVLEDVHVADHEGGAGLWRVLKSLEEVLAGAGEARTRLPGLVTLL